ncbi:MAG: prepilin-type N-terminal cleavage/methylation domain-containing protein [Phycisphaerales bacterium]|nr:prepilin-type N-terminal cleavage/methylation domain-containing protein [Phycisphaerales bacterium]
MKSTTLFRFGKDSFAWRSILRPTHCHFARGKYSTRQFPLRCAYGFTLVELLVVIAIIAMIIALIIVGVGRANQSAQATVCRGNLRTIGIAANTYCSSNKGRFPSPRTETPVGWDSLRTDPNDSTSSIREDASNTYIGWVRTETIVPGSIGGAGNDQYETNIALQKGSLYDYMGGENAYKSPQDPTTRVRTYSLSSFLGVMYCDDFYPQPGDISKNYNFDTRTIARISKPGETLLALPEWNQEKGNPGWNVNGFLGNPEITLVTSGTDPVTYSNAKWYGAPAVWNPGFINMAKVDGSVDSYEIQSPDLKNGVLQSTYTATNGYIDPDGDTYVDLFNIKKLLLPGKIK